MENSANLTKTLGEIWLVKIVQIHSEQKKSKSNAIFCLGCSAITYKLVDFWRNDYEIVVILIS